MIRKLFIYFFFVFVYSGFNVILSQDETSMKDIQNKVTAFTNQLEQDKSFEIVNVTMDLIVKDGSKSFTRYLDPTFDYTITAFGDSRIDRLTLNVNNGTSSDFEYNAESSAANPSISVKPTGYSQYEFTVNNAKYYQDKTSGHFAVIIYHRIP